MALGQPPASGSWPETALMILKFIARIPLAIFVIAGAGCLSWTLFWVLWRLTEYVYRHYLAHSW